MTYAAFLSACIVYALGYSLLRDWLLDHWLVHEWSHAPSMSMFASKADYARALAYRERRK